MSESSHEFSPLTELDFRAITASDVPAWLELCERISTAENAPWSETESDLRDVIVSENDPVADSTIIGVDADGVPRAYGITSNNPESNVGYAFGGVDPQWQRKGIGSKVLDWQLATLRGRNNPSLDTARTYLHGENQATATLLQKNGFQIVRYFSFMLRELKEIPAPRATPGIIITDFTAELDDAVRLAHNEAFKDHWGSEPRTPQQWQRRLEHENFRRDLSSVALDADTGEVAGYQIASVDPLRSEKEGRKEASTDLLGVRRAWRGRGIAPAMLSDAMARFQAAGMEAATLEVDNANPSGAHVLYEGLGYVAKDPETAWDVAL